MVLKALRNNCWRPPSESTTPPGVGFDPSTNTHIPSSRKLMCKVSADVVRVHRIGQADLGWLNTQRVTGAVHCCMRCQLRCHSKPDWIDHRPPAAHHRHHLKLDDGMDIDSVAYKCQLLVAAATSPTGSTSSSGRMPCGSQDQIDLNFDES